MKLAKFVAKRLRTIREALSLSQQEVADELSLSQSLYSLMEGRRASKLSIEKIEKFCEVYKVNPQWLFGDDVRVFTSDDLENTIGRKLKKKEKPAL